MARCWVGTARPDPPPPPPLDAPRSTVPRPAHTRLRETLVDILGLDDGCSDDAIIVAVRMRVGG